MSFAFKFGLIAVFIILSGIISGSEVAFFSLPDEILKNFSKSSSKSKRLVAKLLENHQKLLITILVANNLVNVALSVVGTILTIELSYKFGFNTELAISIEVIILTILILVFSEILPKVIAVKNAVKFSTAISSFVNFLFILLYPITEIMLIFINFIRKKMPKPKPGSFSSNDIAFLVELGEKSGVIGKVEEEIIKNLIEFGDKPVREVMTSRVDMIAVNENASLNEIVDLIKRTGLSRLPVYGEKIDDIKGILYAKDVIPYITGVKRKRSFNIKNILREPIFVPETKTLDSLLEEFKKRKMHIAIVVDEFGGTSGIVTLDDVIEEIFGEVAVEKNNEKLYKKINETAYLFDAMIPLDEFNEIMKLNLTTKNSDYDTLGGFILEITGRIPRTGDVIKYENLKFTIEEVKKHRIKKIKVEVGKDV